MTIVGTAGWTIPARYKERFAGEGSHLERYASQFNGVEINSSFYRPHRRATYERWAAIVPADFRFSVKVPRTVTQEHRLHGYGDLLARFLENVSGLGGKLGVLLAQLPPSLVFNAEEAEAFFQDMSRSGAAITCEPRHAGWFTPEADKALKTWRVARVAADPPRAPGDGIPGGDTGLAYFRLHGSPQIYHSNYSDAAIAAVAAQLRDHDWCIFDNTADFHALGNASTLYRRISMRV